MPIRIEDPFYDPTPRMQEDVNPFVGRLKQGILDGSLPAFFGPSLRDRKGTWQTHFEKQSLPAGSPVVVEIGSHKGDVLSSMASRHSDVGFVGMDITFKRVVTLADKAIASSLPNIVSILCNAKAMDQIFAQGELDGIVIFFPDPWIKKKRQQKNRLINQEFLEKIHSLLKPKGFLWFKTDHKPYFDDVCVSADRMFQTAETSSDSLWQDTYTSTFENKFLSQGLPTYEKVWMKPECE
ncbi:MAG: hypothetical protein HRU19_04920 [Pseudobacteriovorax sp.]|nr:hypothetical protein [Pseudobacteriovorax sp.]